MNPADENAHLEVHVDVPDRDALPANVRTALEEFAAALADEEIQISQEIAEALAEESEVEGFGRKDMLRLGEIDIFGGGGKLGGSGPIVLDWCVGYSSKDGGSCGVFGVDDGDDDVNNCTVRVW